MAPRPPSAAPAPRRHPAIAAALAAGAALLGGCVQHQARIEAAQPPPDAPAGAPGDHPGPTTVITVQRQATDPPAATYTDREPLDLPVSAWRQEIGGSLSRAETRVRTPLAWWQRFPADAVSDLLPWTYTAAADGEVRLEMVAETPEAELLDAARRDGYARSASAPAERRTP